MSKQTAVEWLLRELELHQQGLSKYYSQAAIRNHAHRMEREQIINFANDLLAQNNTDYIALPDLAKQYYDATYGKEASHEG